jgi:hypothetical protein
MRRLALYRRGRRPRDPAWRFLVAGLLAADHHRGWMTIILPQPGARDPGCAGSSVSPADGRVEPTVRVVPAG